MRHGTAVALEVLGVGVIFTALAALMTWPTVLHLREITVGGGELGGWLWRQWWHFQEVDALGQSELGLLDRVRTLVGLGRFPETGNILDILLLSYPLREFFGFPVDHNLKILVVLVGNGLCGYALARAFTDSPPVAVAAAAIALFNPLVILDVNNTGLRQVLLWWLLLYPVFLMRAGRTCRPLDGALAGACFALTAAFYWFYGLFAAMMTAIWAAAWWYGNRPPLRRALRWMGSAALVAAVGAFFFLAPYVAASEQEGGRGRGNWLPETTFLLSYPSYDTVASAPLRPTTYQENVLSSLQRGINSSWPADYVFDPRHGVDAFPLAALLAGVIPGLFLPRARTWLVIWVVFWLGTMGPFLKWGPGKDTAEVLQLGEYVVRMPYTWMFKFIPGMSRMFAPYRMTSIVVVAAIALVSIALDQLRRRQRIPLALLVGAAVVAQPFYRFDIEDEANAEQATRWRNPSFISAIRIPDWYAALDKNGWEGIIELPLEQQQDLLYAYQAFHQRKIYRSWANGAAIPPSFRRAGGGEAGRRLRWLAAPEAADPPTEELFLLLSRDPLAADLSALAEADLNRLLEGGDYRYMIVHERGYYLVDPRQGPRLYREVVRRLGERLGLQGEEMVEQQAFHWPGRSRDLVQGPVWLPWSSQMVALPTSELPSRYFMTVFDLGARPVPAPEAPSQEGTPAPGP